MFACTLHNADLLNCQQKSFSSCSSKQQIIFVDLTSYNKSAINENFELLL